MIDPCNEDVDHPCDALDGEPCARCAGNVRYWTAYYAGFPREAFLSDAQVEASCEDAGRRSRSKRTA